MFGGVHDANFLHSGACFYLIHEMFNTCICSRHVRYIRDVPNLVGLLFCVAFAAECEICARARELLVRTLAFGLGRLGQVCGGDPNVPAVAAASFTTATDTQYDANRHMNASVLGARVATHVVFMRQTSWTVMLCYVWRGPFCGHNALARIWSHMAICKRRSLHYTRR